MIFFCVVSPQLALFGTHSPVHKHKSCLGLGVAKPWWVRVSEVSSANFDGSKPNLARQKAPWLPLIQVSRDIDSRSRLKAAVCNGRFLSCAISRCYPSKPQTLWRRIQCNAAWCMDVPRFRAVQEDSVKLLLGHVLCMNELGWNALTLHCFDMFWPWKQLWFEQILTLEN